MGNSLLQRLFGRFVKMVEAQLRTEALLLVEPHYEATPALERLIRDAKPRQKLGKPRDEMEKAFAYAMQYSSSAMTTTVMEGIRPKGVSLGQTVTGRRPDVVCFDDIERLTKQLMQNAMTTGRFSNKVWGMHDMIAYEPEASPPRASPAWPSSHQGKKGPAPHKPFRNK